MQKLSLIPLALVTLIGVVFAATLLPDNATFPRIPRNPGTIGGALYDLFNADGTAGNSEKLAGKYASGYLQNRDCSGDAINTVWVGVDTAGRGICGRLITPLASIGKFTGLTAGVQVRHIDNSVVTPAIGDILVPGDIVQTNGGTATITFTDDLSVLRLDVATVVELSTGENTLGQSVAQAILSDGRLWGRILTSTGVNLGGGGMVAGVRGTSVSVEENAGYYTLAIIDSRSPTNAATLSSTLTRVSLGSIYTPGTQFTYISGATTAPRAIPMSKADLLTSSLWIRENMKKDIIYLTGSLDEIRVAEYAAAEPTNNQKNRLCIDYSGSLDGKWMSDLYGCQPMSMLAIADYTKTGSLTMAYNAYSISKGATIPNHCGPGFSGWDCFHELTASCDAGQHLVGYHGSCMYPTVAFPVFADNSYPLDNLGNIQEGWNYDCDARGPDATNSAQDSASGGANLTIYCAYNSPSSIIPPLPMIGFAPYATGQGYYINTPGQYISYEFDYSVLAGKMITIELGGIVPTSTTVKRYILDLGTYKVFKNTSGKFQSQICVNGTSCAAAIDLIINSDALSLDIPIPTSIIPIKMIIGNLLNINGLYDKPIGTTIKKITIK